MLTMATRARRAPALTYLACLAVGAPLRAFGADAFFPVGTPGVAWGAAERAKWRAERAIVRSYRDEVLAPLVESPDLGARFIVEQYGALPIDAARYPLFAARTRDWRAGKPCVLVTGGVHGYETSGVLGAAPPPPFLFCSREQRPIVTLSLVGFYLSNEARS